MLSWYYHPFAVEGADVIGADVIKLLIDNGVDVNARYEKLPEVEEDFCDGCTPLHIAVFIWQTESMEKIMKLLIDNGADVNALITGDAKRLHAFGCGGGGIFGVGIPWRRPGSRETAD